MRSLNSMIQMLDGLRGTKDVTKWEDDFIASIVTLSGGGRKTSHLSEPQVEQIDRLYHKHFA